MRTRCEEFQVSHDFRLGGLVTEASHPVTADLDAVARRDVSEALGLLFEVDRDVVERFRDWGTPARQAGSPGRSWRQSAGAGVSFSSGAGPPGG